jgi:hypothetical protein
MTNRTRGAIAAAAGGVALAALFSIVASAGPASTKPTWAVETVLPLTCAQAWVKAHKNYSELVSIVRAEAQVSLANRELTFPNTREAGLDAGKAIAEDCKADPNGLLFAFVDKHVRRIAEAAGASE